MNALVVYDTMAGNTERVARAIAEVLGTGGQARAVRVNEVEPGALTGADILVLGSPTQRWRPTPAMQALLAGLPPRALYGRAAGAFDTRFNKPRWMTGSAAHAMARELRRQGAVLLSPPQSFYVLGMRGPLAVAEIERAAAWAQRLHESHAVRRAPVGADGGELAEQATPPRFAP